MSIEESADDGIPRWHEFMRPVLEVLAHGEPRQRRALIKNVLDHVGITQEQREVLLSGGGSKAENRVGWALSELVAAEAVGRPTRAVYEITRTGHELLEKHPRGITPANLGALPAWAAHKDAVRRKREAASSPQVDLLTDSSVSTTPEERIASAAQELSDEIAAELLDRLRDNTPEFFEEAVVKLLLAMGYGGAEQRGMRVGGTGDGGVDGVIDQDALGLDRVYVQAKRYRAESNISRETVQAFIGALQGFGAHKGVFITTSAFTQAAQSYAQSLQARVILIDGYRLASLMIKYRVGVQIKRRYDVVEIDEDFFE